MNLRGSYTGNNKSNTVRPLRFLWSIRDADAPGLEIQEFNFSLEQDNPFLLG